MLNALSIDLEPWFANEFLAPYLPEKKDDQIEESVRPVLALLDKYGVKATFFVLGIVAEARADIVREIYARGHEIASHAYSHRMLPKLGPEEFEEEIKKSVSLLESITGAKPIGFRAPSFSLDNSTLWALEILIQNGFKYDASIFPMRTNLYGVAGAPLRPYHLSLRNVTEEDSKISLTEFPMTVLKMGLNIPVAGGFYFRLWPYWFIRTALKRVNRTRPAIFYIHPWEMYPGTPRIDDLPAFARFVSRYGIKSALAKFEKLLQEFEFAPVKNVLGIE